MKLSKMAVRVVVSCSVVEFYRLSRSADCLHQRRLELHGPTTQKAAIFIHATARTSNLEKLKTID